MTKERYFPTNYILQIKKRMRAFGTLYTYIYKFQSTKYRQFRHRLPKKQVSVLTLGHRLHRRSYFLVQRLHLAI